MGVPLAVLPGPASTLPSCDCSLAGSGESVVSGARPAPSESDSDLGIGIGAYILDRDSATLLGYTCDSDRGHGSDSEHDSDASAPSANRGLLRIDFLSTISTI